MSNKPDRFLMRLTPSASAGVALSAQRPGDRAFQPVVPSAFSAGGAPKLTAETDYFRKGDAAQVGFPMKICFI